MNLLRKMASFVRSFGIGDANGARAAGVGSGGSDAGEHVNENTALALSAVWACVSLLCGTIASMPLMVYRTGRDGKRMLAKDHPLYVILHDNPNYDQTVMDFWEFMSAALELWGNAYAKILKGADGRVIGLIPIHPSGMSVTRLRNGSIQYRWTADGVQHVEIDTEVLHIRGFGGNPMGGLSPLTFARNTFGLARAIDRSAGNVFANGMRPSGALTFSEFLTSENREIAETKLTEKFVGAMNAGRPLVLEGGATWQPLTINPDDAQMIESRRMSAEEICSIFGVPPFLIGRSGEMSGWGTGLEQQTLGFQKFTLRRRLKRIEAALMKQLLTPADITAGIVIEFNLEGLLRGDSAARTAFYQSALSNGWMTINEVRALENLEPVPGGDVPRMQIQNVPITEAGKVKEIAQ